MEAIAPCGHSIDVGETASPNGDHTVVCDQHDPSRTFAVQIVERDNGLVVNAWGETEVVEG